MLYTAEEVLEYVEQEDVQCIRLAFFDVLGCPKSISIMPSQLRQAFHAGVPFDASAVGFYGSLFLFPQPETLKLLPWHTEEGKTVCLYCSVRRSNGAPFPLDGRYILNQAEREARDMGFSLCFYTEYEFYLFTSDANGNPTKMPHDQAGYMDMAPKDKGENVRRDICLTLEKMGITPVFSCHRPGPGQHQVLCFPASPIEAADNAMTFQAVVHTIAHRNGLHASFAPKPLLRQNSSGLCIRISMGKTGRQQMCSFFAGIREHLREITAFLCPARQSYERLADIRDRQLLFWMAEEEIPYIKLAFPDPAANPYIAFSLLISAGLDGIRRNLIPPETMKISLPGTLEEAFRFAGVSDFIANVLPRQVTEAYMRPVL